MTLVCVRHGESLGNVENRLSGQIDYPLSTLGTEQAHQIGQELTGQFDAIFSSPLIRATQTATLISPKYKTLPEMIERSGGSYEGMTFGELKKLLPPRKYKLWQRDWYSAPLHGESYQDVHDRVVPAFKKHILPLIQKGSRVALVGHSVVMKVLLGHLRGMTEKAIMDMPIENAVPYVFRGPFGK